MPPPIIDEIQMSSSVYVSAIQKRDVKRNV